MNNKAQQISLEQMYSSKQAMKKVFIELGIENTSEELDSSLREQPCWNQLLNLGYQCRDAMLLRTIVLTSMGSKVLSSLVGTLQYTIKDFHQDYTMDHCSEIALNYIVALAKIGFLYIVRKSSKQIIVYPMKVELNQAQIVDMQNRSKFLPPMVAKPKKLTKGRKTPYYTDYPYQLVKHTKARKNTPRDVINILNGLEFTLTDIADLPSPIPAKDITCLDTTNVVALKKFVCDVAKVHKFYKGREFYFAHSFDSRLRVYPIGYHINYQGYEYQKASIDLAHKYKINIPQEK